MRPITRRIITVRLARAMSDDRKRDRKQSATAPEYSSDLSRRRYAIAKPEKRHVTYVDVGKFVNLAPVAPVSHALMLFRLNFF